jgi:thioredoxin-dependent peroxiredoxin
MLAIGSKAPDFKLKLDTGKIFCLRDYYSKNIVVISFFPDGFSNEETLDTTLLLRHLKEAQTLGALVVMVSPKKIDELRTLLATNNLTLPIASDPTLEVCRNYHAFWLRGLGLRNIIYVIDKNGFIRGRLNHHLLTDKSWGTILRLLRELTMKE